MKRITTRKIAGAAIFTALEIVFQIIGNYVSLGPVSLNLSLIPICIGAIVYGPLVGGFLGLVNGVMVIFAPSTMSIFMPLSVGGTILTCLVKGIASGLVAGFIYLPFKGKKIVLGSTLSSISLPIVNSGLFACGALLFFRTFLIENVGAFSSPEAFLFLGVIGWNFIFELSVSLLLCPVIVKVISVVVKKND